MKIVESLLPGGHAALTYSSRDASGLAALAPLQQSDGYDAADEDHASHQTAAAGAAESLFHVREPERPDEAPSRADDVDEDADAGTVLDHAVDGVGDENGGDDLVADGGDGNADLGVGVSKEVQWNNVMGGAYDRRDVPYTLRRLLEANAEHDQTNHGQDETHVAEPKSVLRFRTASKLLSALVHPEIADPATELLADDKTDHDTKELKAKFLGVETELGKEQLRNLNGEENTAEAEDDGVGDCGDPNGGVTEEREGLDELVETERRGVDTLEGEVLLLEGGNVVTDDIAHVESLGAKEEVRDELNTVGLKIVSLM
jgi:hypothetical protein